MPRLRLLALYLAGWLALGIWNGLNSLIGHSGQVPAWMPFTWELSSALALAALAPGVAWLEKRFPLGDGHTLRHLPVHVLAVAPFCLLHVGLMIALRKAVYLLAGTHYRFGGGLALFYEFQKDLLTYVVIVGACALLRIRRERRRRELDALRLARESSEARLAQLSAQLEPHFMFNALNTIANRMHEDVADADRLLVALADLLRAALAGAQSPYARVRDELDWLRSYCALMSGRQPGRLQADLDAEAATLDARLPRLLLQPLVENAFRHGLASGRGRLAVQLVVANGRLHCRVSDDGAGFAAGREGVGLANVRERLRLLYGARAGLQIAPRPSGGTEVRVTLPLEPMDG